MAYNPRDYVKDYSYKARAAQGIGQAATQLAQGIGSAVQTHKAQKQDRLNSQELRNQFSSWLSKLKPDVLQDIGVNDPVNDLPDPQGMDFESYQKALKQWMKPRRNAIKSLVKDPDTLQNLIKGSPVDLDKEIEAAKKLYREDAVDEFLSTIESGRQYTTQTEEGLPEGVGTETLEAPYTTDEAEAMAREAKIADDPRVQGAIGGVRSREQIEAMQYGGADTAEGATQMGIGKSMAGGQARPLEPAAKQMAGAYGTGQQKLQAEESKARIEANKALADKRRSAIGAGGEDPTKPSEEHLYAVRKQIDKVNDDIARYEGEIAGVDQKISTLKDLNKKLNDPDLDILQKQNMQEQVSELGTVEELAAQKARMKRLQKRLDDQYRQLTKEAQQIEEEGKTEAARNAAKARAEAELEGRWEEIDQYVQNLGAAGPVGADVGEEYIEGLKRRPDIPEGMAKILTPGLFNRVTRGDPQKPVLMEGGKARVNLNSKEVQMSLAEGFSVEDILKHLKSQSNSQAVGG